MEAVFLKLLNMSITASYLVAAVVLLRLILKKAPKIISLILWALVGVRLILPISFESIFSLVPSTQTFPSDITTSPLPTINSGIPVLNNNINPIISQTFAPTVTESVSPMQIITFVASIVWVVGVAVMLTYALISYIRIRRRVREAVKLEGNVMLCDNIASPFILGIIRPKIYIPSTVSEQDMHYVLAHENAHLKRRDHFWKPFGFLLLSIYWFNPVLWVAYILLCRDIELACDEKVIKQLGTDAKKPYSTALVNCSVSRKAISVCPLAFGEVGVKRRVKTVLNYKKPAFWIIIVALIICVVVAVCFLTNPPSKDDTTTTTTSPSTTLPDVTEGDFVKVGADYLWSGTPNTTYIDSVDCDIDSDGIHEEVRLYYGPTSGLTSYVVGIWQNGVLETCKMMFSKPISARWRFDRAENGVVYIKQTVTEYGSDKEEVTMLKLYNKDKNLVVVSEDNGEVFITAGSNMEISSMHHTFDIDGDGKKEYCMIVPDDAYPHTLFKFIVLQNEDDTTPKYYNMFSFDSVYSLYFAENNKGQVKLFGVRNGYPATEIALDISVENEEIVLTENGKAWTPYYISLREPIEYTSYYYYFDYKNSANADLNGDGIKGMLYLGYMRYNPAFSSKDSPYRLSWVLCITDGKNSQFIPLDLNKSLIIKATDNKIYIKEDIGGSLETIGEVIYENGKYSVVNAQRQTTTKNPNVTLPATKPIENPTTTTKPTETPKDDAKLLKEGNFKSVAVTSLPGGYEYSFEGESVKAIVDYFNKLNLVADFEDNPNEYVGMTWVVTLENENGDITTLYHFGNMFIMANNGPWYKMTYEEAIRFDALLDELSK